MAGIELKAMSAGVEKFAPGAVVANLVVRWARRGSKVYLDRVNHEMHAEHGSGLERSV